jgi:hypothetical protein
MFESTRVAPCYAVPSRWVPIVMLPWSPYCESDLVSLTAGRSVFGRLVLEMLNTLPCYYSIQAYRGDEVNLHTFLTSELNGGSLSAHVPACVQVPYNSAASCLAVQGLAYFARQKWREDLK